MSKWHEWPCKGPSIKDIPFFWPILDLLTYLYPIFGPIFGHTYLGAIHKGCPIFFGLFWTYLLTNIRYLGPFLDLLTYLNLFISDFCKPIYSLTGMSDILYGRHQIKIKPLPKIYPAVFGWMFLDSNEWFKRKKDYIDKCLLNFHKITMVC